MRSDLISQFILRMKDSEHSSVTLAGTGPNGSSQLCVLAEIGRTRIREMSRVNVISGSSISYFIYIAMSEGGFRPDGYRRYDKLVRNLHKGTPLRLVRHFLSGRYRNSSYFENVMLHDTLSIFFEEEFIRRPLQSFDPNARFFTYCLAGNELVEISNKNYPDMTVSDICRACFSIPFLHGAFRHGYNRFVDPTFTERFAALRRQLLHLNHNHLYVNVKKEGESRNILFVKNEDTWFPIVAVFVDFLFLCLGVPNPRVDRTHIANLDIHQDFRQ